MSHTRISIAVPFVVFYFLLCARKGTGTVEAKMGSFNEACDIFFVELVRAPTCWLGLLLSPT